MCMGGGGGGSPAVITMPDTGAYDRQFQDAKELILLQQEGAQNNLQATLDSTLRDQTSLLSDLKELKTTRAEEAASVEAEAVRLSNLIGTPPPEAAAQAVVVGDVNRAVKEAAAEGEVYKPEKKGKKALRIPRATSPTTSSAGTGYNLNIT